MKVDLEKYIKDHRLQLDDIEELNIDEMWKDFVEKDKPTSKPKFNWYKVAAIGIVLIAAVTIFSQNISINQDELIHKKLSQSDLNLALEQENLVKLISNQGEAIEKMGIDEKQFPDLFQELKVLDTLQMEAMQDLENYQDRRNLYKALMRNYESKVRVLELIINEFDKQENERDYEKSIQI
jgi:hypothetical protein